MASIWREKNGGIVPRAQLQGEFETEAAVIGGGLTGILTAYRLQEQGIKTCVLEADAVGSGTTGGSTGKITAQHGLIYAKLIHDFGRAQAREYARQNSRAVESYARLVEKEGIDCDFVRCSAYVYSHSGMAALREEGEAAKRLGIDAVLAEVTKLPFPVDGALCFPEQARFDPLAFTRALAACVERMGATIFEKTRVTGLEDMRILTAQGMVRAKHIVFACHYPIVNIPGYYFLRMSQQRSFAVALRGVPSLSGVYIDQQQGGLSFRSARFGEEDVLILAAYDVRSGKNTVGGKYRELLSAARKLYPDCELVAQWSEQDCRTVDEVPYIGRYSAETPNWYVATGFNKWGITNAMVAAGRLSSLIMGEAAEEEESVYNPARFKLLPSMKNLAGDAGNALAGFAKAAFSIPAEKLTTLPRGEGSIVEHAGEKYAVYRDEAGETHVLPSRCPHLGCRLEWNPDDRTWECPCHGSRFGVDGEILSEPAVYGLAQEKDNACADQLIK